MALLVALLLRAAVPSLFLRHWTTTWCFVVLL
jgi:hypothetical protein